MTHGEAWAPDASEIAFAYHERIKHRLERYSAGPETLDWDMQPNPIREFKGCRRIALPLAPPSLAARFSHIYAAGMAPAALSINSVGTLMQLSLGLSAWKEYGPDRWALRCNPSSGNLHPTEAYLLSYQVPGLDNGLYHYVCRDHSLEMRCMWDDKHDALRENASQSLLFVGLASIHWREAWKYGKRAFRYCQLDIGHAIGALRYAAGVLGWSAKAVEGIGSEELEALLGLDRTDDSRSVETEEPYLLIAIRPRPLYDAANATGGMIPIKPGEGTWHGRPNRLGPHPMYRWPVIDQVATATRGAPAKDGRPCPSYPALTQTSDASASHVILKRRSAQRFDRNFTMDSSIFFHMLDCLLARPAAPWDVWGYSPRIHPVFFVYRVVSLSPGVYALSRHPDAELALRDSLSQDFIWQKVESAPAHLPLFKLLSADCRSAAGTVSCHQAIARDSCFALGMLAEFDAVVRLDPWRYRQLHWEAGLVGHVLYLEAEAAGLRGIGIGCFFDDVFHELLGVTDRRFQSLYHFTAGFPLTDERITTLPPYLGCQTAIEEPV
ncbi:MAG TPA: SagB family peptide dehydrogenase [Methylocella sp.]|nr:SagB family peptide dehydrogenase [Methylocella sp.]